MKRKKMVLGFVFDKAQKYVLLIENKKQDKYNGLGGHVESLDNDSPRAAMSREAKEESGIDIAANDWSHDVTIYPVQNEPFEHFIYVFSYTLPRPRRIISSAEGVIGWIPLGSVRRIKRRHYNLPWLIELALDQDPALVKPVHVYYKGVAENG